MQVNNPPPLTPIGSLPLASQAQAQAGTDNSTVMTPLRVAQALAVLAALVDGSGNVLIGTHARLVPLTNGFKSQTSNDGTTWVDGPTYTAS